MNINRLNYESVLIDYLDGKLSPNEMAELKLFLLQNEDIAQELEGIQDVLLQSGEEVFAHKALLKKTNTEYLGNIDYTDYLCIAELEEDINPTEKTQLNQLLKTNEASRGSHKAFAYTKLSSPTNIIYPYKSNIKRLGIISIRHSWLRIGIASAASLAIMLTVYSTLDTIHPTRVAINPGITNTAPSENGLEVKPAKTEKPITPKASAPHRENTKTVAKQVIEREKNNEAVEIDRNSDNLKPISHLPVKLSIAANLPKPEQINIKTLSTPTTPETNQTKFIGSTKEYTLADVARIGFKKVINTLGIEYDIQKNENGKIQKLTIESSMLAFSTTKSGKDE